MINLEHLLSLNESKNLEFKESTASSLNIIKTVIAFANTAGGIIVIGVKDKTKEILGIKDILLEEEKLANIISDSINPLLIPDLEIVNYQNKELIIINVPYLVGPYYFKKANLEKGTYIRLGSTNRLADTETISYLQRLAKQVSFDEMPCVGAKSQELDDTLIANTLSPVYKHLTKKNYKSLNLLAEHQHKVYPTNGGVLLFAANRLEHFPDSVIRCVCFKGETREYIIDQKDVNVHLIAAADECIAFINRHTNLGAKIGTVKREDRAQFPPQAIREAVMNAIVHADYAMKGTSIQIAVFANRIELTNPGALPFGQTLDSALSGISRLRNRMIGRIFRELKLIEKLGSGLPRILAVYKNNAHRMPIFEEIDRHFRVTLFEVATSLVTDLIQPWEQLLLTALSKEKSLTTKQIAVLWKVTARTTRTRLKNMLERGLLQRKAHSKNDPKAVYALIK